MAYVPAATRLGANPDAVAMALTVSLAETEIGPVYRVEVVVGVEPSVV